ncbi:MAG: hypothetical protein SOY46_07380 [Butyrivibrio crossotus]|nr:hypothetical protein [Butyrivibrio crossotus]MDY4029058.1 hypothetical protein [Butyrivibrio crossotus]
MKKLFTGIIILTMAVGLFGCSKSDSNGETTIDNTKESVTDTTDNPTTESEGNNSGSDDMDSAEIEKKIVSIFEDGIDKGTDIEEIAKLIAPVGGYEIAPVIGSIPYVSYIFETDDAEALAAQLKKSANPRWNICTEANEPVIKVKDNYVFLTMCPGADW